MCCTCCAAVARICHSKISSAAFRRICVVERLTVCLIQRGKFSNTCDSRSGTYSGLVVMEVMFRRSFRKVIGPSRKSRERLRCGKRRLMSFKSDLKQVETLVEDPSTDLH